jgi:hypothetical protein
LPDGLAWKRCSRRDRFWNGRDWTRRPRVRLVCKHKLTNIGGIERIRTLKMKKFLGYYL